MKTWAILLVSAAVLCGCAPMAENEQSAPPAAAPQSLLPQDYSGPPAVATLPPAPTYSVAPVRVRSGRDFSGTVFNPYHPEWTINVQ